MNYDKWDFFDTFDLNEFLKYNDINKYDEFNNLLLTEITYLRGRIECYDRYNNYYLKMMKLILKSGADPMMKDNWRNSITIAMDYNAQRTLKLLNYYRKFKINPRYMI
jgi:small nuclear ribonucleoprotein (snRNP)-like protein